MEGLCTIHIWIIKLKRWWWDFQCFQLEWFQFLMKKVNDFSPQFFFQIREWMIHFKSGLAVAQVMVGDLLFEIEMWLIVIASKFLKKKRKKTRINLYKSWRNLSSDYAVFLKTLVMVPNFLYYEMIEMCATVTQTKICKNNFYWNGHSQFYFGIVAICCKFFRSMKFAVNQKYGNIFVVTQRTFLFDGKRNSLKICAN